jgi:deoxyribonuclease V
MPSIPFPELHRWDVSPAEAIQIQKTLVSRLHADESIPLSQIQTVAGVDVSVKNNQSRAAIVVLAFPTLEVIEVATARIPTPFPYIPGLLSFREGAVILQAYARLSTTPDVLIFDGQGQAHPRRLGIAAHLGLWLGQPTIGCGKTRLIGTHHEPGQVRGDFEQLWDDQGDVIGVVLRTRPNVKPVYISSGTRCNLDSARKIVMACVTRYRLPEPIRAAHHTAGLDEQAGDDQP